MFNLADIFILPSFYESYAMALVEAMSCGCAIVASETGACPEITAGAALLANPYEPDDFAEKIKRILTNGSLKTDLESKSIERAKFFTWERTAQRTIKEIARIVEKTS